MAVPYGAVGIPPVRLAVLFMLWSFSFIPDKQPHKRHDGSQRGCVPATGTDLLPEGLPVLNFLHLRDRHRHRIPDDMQHRVVHLFLNILRAPLDRAHEHGVTLHLLLLIDRIEHVHAVLFVHNYLKRICTHSLDLYIFHMLASAQQKKACRQDNDSFHSFVLSSSSICRMRS